jgi:hypothetical protein
LSSSRIKPIYNMKILYLILAIAFTSCFTSKGLIVPPKSQYPTTPIIITSSNQFDVVWDKLIDLFAQKGLSIKIIDRSSGLIISEKTMLTHTTERNNGTLKDSLAFTVGPRHYDKNTKKYNNYYFSAVGEWNVRLKKADNGGTLINVNLVNIEAQPYVPGSLSNQSVAYLPASACRTTGVFEKIISDIIK